MNNNVVNLISFLSLLINGWATKVLAAELEVSKEILAAEVAVGDAAKDAVEASKAAVLTAEQMAIEVMAIVMDVPSICNKLINVARGVHRREIVPVGYWNTLRMRLLNMSVQDVMLNPFNREFAVRWIEHCGIKVNTAEGEKVLTKDMDKAIKDGELFQMQLFGQELYRYVKGIVKAVEYGTVNQDSANWQKCKELYDWWWSAKELYKEGFVVANNGSAFCLVKREVLPMPEKNNVTKEGLEEVARLLSIVITRKEDLKSFFLHGVDGLSKEYLDKFNASDSDLGSAKYRIGSIARIFIEHWSGGEQEAIQVLNLLTGFASADSSGLIRALRALVRGAHDLGVDARISKNSDLNPIFHLGTMPNGVPCLWMYRNKVWMMVITAECTRLRKTVITEDNFKKAVDTPSIVCQYAGSRMIALVPLTSYNTQAKDGNKGVNLLVNRILSTVGMRKFGVIPTVNVNTTSSKDATRWLRFIELPNLVLHTRLDHISGELSIGNVKRTLIYDELDNVLVVANILSRSQYSNSTRELCGETKLPSNLKYSGKDNGRLYRLFPKITPSGMKIPGDLLTLAGKVFEELLNPRWANGTTCTIIGDPRIGPNECLLPAYLKAFVLKVGTSFAKVAKMPNYMTFELEIVGYAEDNVLHINPALAAMANADFDGDQMQIQLTITNAPELSPSSQGGHYLRTYQRESAVVGIPTVSKPDYDTDFYNMVAGKGLIGVGVEFWRQAMQLIKELNPFKLEYVHDMFIKHNDAIVRILETCGYDNLIVDGKADWDMFVYDFPLGKKQDYFADLTASILFELIMPKTKFDAEALAILGKMGIDPKSLKTLAGQLNVMNRVSVDPIGTLEVFMTLDNKLIKRWLPRVIISMLALHRVCNDRGLTVTELVASAPAGGAFHLSKRRWKEGFLNIMKCARNGFMSILGDKTPVELTVSDSSVPASDVDDEDAGNKFFGNRNVYDQKVLIRAFMLAGGAHHSRMSHSNGVSYLPTIYALEMFKLYIELVDGMILSILPYKDEDGIDCYALLNGTVVCMEGIRQRLGGQPDEEFADFYYMDILCPVCGAVYGYCEHCYCAKCKKPIGTCPCTTPEDVKYNQVDDQLNPSKALAWLLTRPNLGANEQARPGVDTVLASLRTTMTSEGNKAWSNGDVFNRFMIQFMRKLAYKPGTNVSLQARQWGSNHGYNLNMVAVDYPICPIEAAKATHPADAAVESSKFAIQLAKKYHLCPTTTSSSKPGKWMRHMAPKSLYASFIKLFDVAYSWTTSKRDAVRIKFEQSAPIVSGGVVMPVAWEGVPIEILPQVFAPATVYHSMEWNDLDQVAFTPEYMDTMVVDRLKKPKVKKGFIVHVDEDMTFTLVSKDGEYHGRHVLITDPSESIAPVIIEEIGNATYIVEFVGEFEETPDGFVALEDASLELHSATTGCTAMKMLDPFGNKGLGVKIQSIIPDRFVLLVDKLVKVEAYLSPDRFSTKKMQAGSSVVNAVFTQIRKLMIDNGTLGMDEPLRVPTDIPQEEMLEFALMWLHSELSSRLNISEELIEKIELATIALQKAETTEERVKALWSLAFHPMFEVVDGQHVHIADVMLSYHPFAVQNLFPQENCTVPKSRVSEDLLKFDRNGFGSLNIRQNNSKGGMALRMNYAGMTISRCPELMDELYGQYELYKNDSAKVYLWEQIMSCAMQCTIVAFPELGPVSHPHVVCIKEDSEESNTEEIATLVCNEESTDESVTDCDYITVVND